jgi:hypothetical protein
MRGDHVDVSEYVFLHDAQGLTGSSSVRPTQRIPVQKLMAGDSWYFGSQRCVTVWSNDRLGRPELRKERIR